MAKQRLTRSGFPDAASDKIWCDHLGNNAFVRHRDRCSTCLERQLCREGDEILGAVIDEVVAQIDEVRRNRN